jgi:hypothetical protein
MVQDNFKSTMQEIAQFILDNAPEGMSDHDRDFMLNSKEPCYRTYFNTRCDGVNDQTSVGTSMYVEADDVYDDDGNEYGVYQPTFSVNCDSLYGATIERAQAHMCRLLEVTLLVQLLQEKFGNTLVCKYRKSAAEVQEDAAYREEQALLQRVRNVVSDVKVKHMRIGHARVVDNDVVKDIPVGSYDVSKDKGREYKLVVTADVSTIIRTA